MKQVCKKHGITEDQLTKAGLEVLKRLPDFIDNVEVNSASALVDVLLHGDIKDQDEETMQTYLHRASAWMVSHIECKNCVFNGHCFEQESKNQNVSDVAGCVAMFMFYAQKFGRINPVWKKEDVLVILEDKKEGFVRFYKESVDNAPTKE